MAVAGTYVDDNRQVRCRATGKLALSHRVAVERARTARRRKGTDPVTEYRCMDCCWWHIGHQQTPRSPVPRRRRPRTPRRRGW